MGGLLGRMLTHPARQKKRHRRLAAVTHRSLLVTPDTTGHLWKTAGRTECRCGGNRLPAGRQV